MSTRAQIRFATREAGQSFNQHPSAIHAQFYKHSDGYPEGLGLDIADSIMNNVGLNGIEIEPALLRTDFTCCLNNDETKKLFEKIKESIIKNGFENTAAIYSISETSKTGGSLGWVSENTINKNILSNISKIKIGEFTNPILIPGGFLILKVKDIKEIEKKIDIEKELNLRIRSMQNQQLNQYSNIYYKKVKKDILIDEK